MAFKGHARRRTLAQRIAEEIEAVGGDLNAATGAESTAYYARVLKADVPLAIDVLSDILSEPAFDRDELVREQNVIVQEIGAVADTPDDLILEHLQVIAFPDQPLGRSILGTPKTVRSFDGGKLRDYLGRNYRAPDIVVAARQAPSTTRASWPKSSGVSEASTARRARSRRSPNSAVALTSRSASWSRFTLRSACPACRRPTRRSTACKVFTRILGGGMSSRLFQEARERRGHCYSIYSFHVPYTDVGMFGLYAGTDAADTSELMRLIVDEIASTIETISEPEVARAKAQMKAGLLMALESSGARIEQLARQMITRGRPVPLDELVQKVESVSVESARAAGRALIAGGKLATAVIGLGSGLESAAAIAETLTRRAA